MGYVVPPTQNFGGDRPPLSPPWITPLTDGSVNQHERCTVIYISFIYRNIYTHRTVTEFIAHGSTCTFLARYMKDNFPSPTAVIGVGLHVCLHPLGTPLSAGAAPHRCVAPRLDTPITR